MRQHAIVHLELYLVGQSESGMLSMECVETIPSSVCIPRQYEVQILHVHVM